MNATLIVGLGNPGREYERTRHNLGFRVLDELVRGDADAWSPWKRERDVLVATHNANNTKFFALKPQTFMNDSGIPVARFVKFYQIPLDTVWVVHDDIDLPFGEIRDAFDRGSAGHKGVESIIEHLGSPAFHRLRVGIGSNRKHDLAAEDYVLENFSYEEESRLKEHDGVIAKTADWIVDRIGTSTK